MNMTIKAMLPEERDYCYSQDEDVMKASGCIGHLRGDMDSNGTGFFTSWDNHTAEKNDAAFKAEFDSVVNMLRFDERYEGLLKNRSSLAAYGYGHTDTSFGDDRNFGVRADTEEHTYMIRCNPNRGEYNFYIYAYDREMLEQHMEEAKHPEKMTVLVVEPEKAPYVKEIGTGLEALQHEVGGYIQAVYPFEDSDVALICNEDGKLTGLPLNRALRDEDGQLYDIVAGTFLVTGLSEDNFTSLSKEQLQKFSDVYKTPEMFFRVNNKIVAIPLAEEKAKKPSVLAKLDALKKVDAPVKKKTHEMEER